MFNFKKKKFRFWGGGGGMSAVASPDPTCKMQMQLFSFLLRCENLGFYIGEKYGQYFLLLIYYP